MKTPISLLEPLALSKKTRTVLLFLLLESVILFHLAAFVAITNVVPRFSKAFGSTYSMSLRLQTEAFLNGKLTVQTEPFNNFHDWAWGIKGWQQVWGLGVPLLRLPFDLIAKAVGAVGFPDRLTLLLWFGFAMSVLFWGFHLTTPRCLHNRHPALPTVQNLLWISFIMVNPVFLFFAATRFLVYEETIAYGCIWAFFLLGLLLILQSRPTFLRFFILSAACGFGIFIRPTIAFYSVTTVVLAAWLARRKNMRWRHILTGCAVCAFGIAATLALNKIRFGAFLEFGHRLNLSGVPPNEFALRFGYPFAKEPFFRAAQELFSLLFLSPPLSSLNYYLPDVFQWQSPTLRFRELVSDTYDLKTLFLLAMSIPALVTLFFVKRHPNKHLVHDKNPVGITMIWGWSNTLLLSFFYLRSPSITSRYLVDFFPAIAATVIAVGMAVSLAIHYVLGCRAFMWQVLFFVFIWFVVLVPDLHFKLNTNPLNIYAEKTMSSAETKSSLRSYRRLRKGPAAKIIDAYSCPDKDATHNITHNTSGWNIDTDCEVSVATTLFFSPAACVELTVAPGSAKAGRLDEEAVQVKSNLNYLKLESVRKFKQNTVFTFCAENPKPLTTPYQMVSVAWIHPDQLGKIEPNCKLLKARIVEKPAN